MASSAAATPAPSTCATFVRSSAALGRTSWRTRWATPTRVLPPSPHPTRGQPPPTHQCKVHAERLVLGVRSCNSQKRSTESRDAAYAPTNGEPVTPRALDTPSAHPAPRWRIDGTAALTRTGAPTKRTLPPTAVRTGRGVPTGKAAARRQRRGPTRPGVTATTAGGPGHPPLPTAGTRRSGRPSTTHRRDGRPHRDHGGPSGWHGGAPRRGAHAPA